MTEDRRSTSRCPICAGPAIVDQSYPDSIRCKNSACRHNHANARCPRCNAQDLAQVTWTKNCWKYTCADCENTWQSSSAN